jgi:serine/threonine protein kinase
MKLTQQPSEDPFCIVSATAPVDPYCQCHYGSETHLPTLVECRSTSGTHGYMAPEIYAPGHRHGYPVDYFAIGVTMHELVLGQRPFEARYIRFLILSYTPLTMTMMMMMVVVMMMMMMMVMSILT